MSNSLRRFGSTADGRQDWVFRSFVAFAVVMGGYTALHHIRLDRALRRASTCLAQADAACASRAVDDARVIEANHPRVRLAGMDLHLLLGEVDAAKAELAGFNTGEISKNLTPAAHGDMLLLQGDLDAAAGTFAPAKQHYAAARLLVEDENVVVARLARLGQREQRMVEERAALFADFNHLFEEAEAMNSDAVPLRARDLTRRLMKLSNRDVQTKLALAVSAAERAANASIQAGRLADRPGLADSPRPTPPVRDDTVERTAQAERAYQRKLTEYQHAVEVYEEWRTAKESTRLDRAAAASRSCTQNLTEARALFAEARALLEKEGSVAR